MFCDLLDGTTVQILETPDIFTIHDKSRSWKTEALLPKRGKLRNFKEMPTTLEGLLKLVYSNGVGRLLRSDNVPLKLGLK